MSKMGWVLGAVLALGVGNAFAQPVEDFRFECRFTGDQKGFEQCVAVGGVRGAEGRMQIACNGQVVYRDGLTRQEHENFTKLFGLPRPPHQDDVDGNHPPMMPPVIVLITPEEVPSTVSGWLRIDHALLRGFCNISALPQ